MWSKYCTSPVVNNVARILSALTSLSPSLRCRNGYTWLYVVLRCVPFQLYYNFPVGSQKELYYIVFSGLYRIWSQNPWELAVGPWRDNSLWLSFLICQMTVAVAPLWLGCSRDEISCVSRVFGTVLRQFSWTINSSFQNPPQQCQKAPISLAVAVICFVVPFLPLSFLPFFLCHVDGCEVVLLAGFDLLSSDGWKG